MDVPILSNNTNDIYGVSTYPINEAIRIKFQRPLSIDSWHVLLKNINELIERGLLNLEFDLTELEHPCSTDIGMWVTCISRIKLKLGKIDFIVKKGSHVHMLLEFTRLIEIFNVILVK
jgi:hypothetical protein